MLVLVLLLLLLLLLLLGSPWRCAISSAISQGDAISSAISSESCSAIL